MNIELITVDPRGMMGQKPKILSPENYGWIAGGSIRRWFTGEKNVSDIDIFFKSKTPMETYQNLLVIHGQFKQISETPLNISYSDGNTLQCVRVNFFNDVQSLLDSFDFTICQFAYDGKMIYSTSEAIISVLRKHLRVHNIQKNFAIDSLRRAFKYTKSGFFPVMALLWI